MLAFNVWAFGKVRFISLTALAALAIATAPAAAGSATSDFTVTAEVADNCTITTAAIAFGPYDPIVTNATTHRDAAGSVTITCTQGAVATIGLSAGANGAGAVGTTRSMMGGTERLNYEIYQETGRTTVWGNSGGALLSPVAAPSSAARSFTTFGRIPAGQDVKKGSNYTDTVTATVNF